MTAASQGGMSANAFHVHKVPPTRPVIWLARGWDDLVHHKVASIAYGLLVAVLGGVIMVMGRHPYYLAASISGFMLIGPILTAGLCQLSMRHDENARADFDESLHGLRHNRPALIQFGGLLVMISAVWFGASSMMLHTILGTAAPEFSYTMWGDVMANVSSSQLLGYLVTGSLLAFVVLAVSVVTVPMIVHCGADARYAVRTSVRVTLRDLPAMIVWGMLIAGLVVIGFATFLLGMIVIFPLLGHATWYAYRDLVQ